MLLNLLVVIFEQAVYLIAGLGNPGEAYHWTRHNVGFLVIDALAAKYQWEFRKVKSFHGLLAQGMIEGKKILLLKPQTYMNSSGESIKVCSSYYKVPMNQMFVLCDDIYLPFGSLRIKTSGILFGEVVCPVIAFSMNKSWCQKGSV